MVFFKLTQKSHKILCVRLEVFMVNDQNAPSSA